MGTRGSARLVLPGDRRPGQVVNVLEIAEERAWRKAGPLRDLVGSGTEIALLVEVEQRVDRREAVLHAPPPPTVGHRPDQVVAVPVARERPVGARFRPRHLHHHR